MSTKTFPTLEVASVVTLPIGNPDFRVALNRLSNAEDELFKLARE